MRLLSILSVWLDSLVLSLCSSLKLASFRVSTVPEKISNQMCQMCGKYIYIQYITLEVYIYYVHMLLYSRDDDHPEL